MNKWKIALLAAVTALPAPAQAADAGFDRSIQRVVGGIEATLGLPVQAYDAVTIRVAAMRLHHRAHFAHGILHGALDAPRAVFSGTASGIRGLVTSIAREEGVPEALAHGVVRIESNYSCAAHNRSGASGIMQVLPRTARGVGVYGNLHSCSTGLRAGMRYLRQAFVRAGGNMCAAASLYNSGIAGSGRCSAYGRQVLRFART